MKSVTYAAAIRGLDLKLFIFLAILWIVKMVKTL
jgi:hypothetical protein